MTDRDLMHQALDALKYASGATKPEGLHRCECLICKAIPALQDRLSKPHIKVGGPLHVVCQCYKCVTQNRWVGLTDEDRQELAAEQHSWEGLCRAIEAKLREKNGD